MTALWARSTSAGTDQSQFFSVAKDGAGNVYAAGYQSGTGGFTYGPGGLVSGAYAGTNALLVKYDSSGKALWARSTTIATNQSIFSAVTVDSSGNIYASGYQMGTAAFNYAAGISATGANTNGNALLVKYDAAGNALWARSATTAPNQSNFSGVAVDSSDNIYAVGLQWQNGSFSYAAGVSVSGASAINANAVIVKYNSSGTAQWARSTTAGTAQTSFVAITVDGLGNIYAVGEQNTNTAVTYAPGVSVAGAYNSTLGNVLLVRYDNNGNAIWARSTTGGSTYSAFNAVATDAAGNIYAAGHQTTNSTFSYSPGVSATVGYPSDMNAALVKYDSSGNALWARSTVVAPSSSGFSGVVVDSNGNVYAAGYQGRKGLFSYGGGAIVGGASNSNNVVIVKYDATGNPLTASSTTTRIPLTALSAPPSAASHSGFGDILLDSAGNIYAAGYQYGNGEVNYDGASATGSYAGGPNGLLVKYQP